MEMHNTLTTTVVLILQLYLAHSPRLGELRPDSVPDTFLLPSAELRIDRLPRRKSSW